MLSSEKFSEVFALWVFTLKPLPAFCPLPSLSITPLPWQCSSPNRPWSGTSELLSLGSGGSSHSGKESFKKWNPQSSQIPVKLAQWGMKHCQKDTCQRLDLVFLPPPHEVEMAADTYTCSPAPVVYTSLCPWEEDLCRTLYENQSSKAAPCSQSGPPPVGRV